MTVSMQELNKKYLKVKKVELVSPTYFRDMQDQD